MSRMYGPAALVVAVAALVVSLGVVPVGAAPEVRSEAQQARTKSVTRNFNRQIAAPDNGESGVIQLANVSGLARITATCRDGNPAAGTIDPQGVVTALPRSGSINYARLLSRARPRGDTAPRPVIGAVPINEPQPLVIPGSDTFDLRMERAGRVAQLLGVQRQDGPTCLFYGVALAVSD
jgi:hypothetical protein